MKLYFNYKTSEVFLYSRNLLVVIAEMHTFIIQPPAKAIEQLDTNWMTRASFNNNNNNNNLNLYPVPDRVGRRIAALNVFRSPDQVLSVLQMVRSTCVFSCLVYHPSSTIFNHLHLTITVEVSSPSFYP